jgi:hypothetical protein
VCTVSSRNNFDALLRGFLAGDKSAREALPRVAERYVLKIARILGADLPEDLHREVVNQAFLNLMRQKPGSYNPARGAAGTFLKLMLRNAVRQVRASYIPPGYVTRIRKKKGTTASVTARGAGVTSIDELQQDEMPRVDGGIPVVEARHDAEALLRHAPLRLAITLRRLYLDGGTLKEVAVVAGISRFKLRRQIADFAQQVRLAA